MKKNHVDVIAKEFGAVEEYRFCQRRWRFDWAIPHAKIAIEYEGGVYTTSRHTSPRGYANDCEKYNTAGLLGWIVLRVSTACKDNIIFQLINACEKREVDIPPAFKEFLTSHEYRKFKESLTFPI